MSLTLFEKIINREIKADIVYEDDLCIVINDINPQAPTHLLIIPKKVIPKLSDASADDQKVLGHLLLIAGKISDQLQLDETFRLIINNGAKAGQSIFHLHLHLISGRPLNWPPG
ncbi:MAG: histidine triad nucleotide-binding protein [Gammaproteobacteria bacterium]|nr:histidine triad nucleotide-binding protein [Gammaproteobacteria bacterium]|tara:strand:+ start:2403 stop:2744 length:342 start_codon:yes stop_codon:yes gene_type:complete